jgi:DNA-binding NarL/FixJ family response regulator/3-polyprenyl-4-hydroxybenzoate decarboxylase
MANILLIATGGTRAPTQIELAETFMRDGHQVRLIASANALRFLSAYLLRNPSKIPLYLRHYRAALREKFAYYKAKPAEVPHIAEGKWCDVVVMAPATCNSIGKLASGLGDNYPLLVLRAIPRTRRVIVVPSMNPEMWYDPMVQRNIDVINATEKFRVLCPTRGQMLSGDFGIGAQVSLQQIVTETYRTLGLVGLEANGHIVDSVPWGEQPLTEAETGHMVLVDPEQSARDSVSEALRLEYPHLKIHDFASATHALNWLQSNRAVAVFTELDFPEGVSGWDLIQRLRRPGCEQTQVIATSRRSRQEVGAERLGRLDVLFAPKPFSVPFVVGMIAGAIRAGAPRRDALPTRMLARGERLFAQGEMGKQAYIVRSGRLRVTKTEHGHEVEIGISEVGEMAGELSVLDGSVRAASATALEATEVQVLNLDSMRRYLETQPTWLRLTLDSLAGHLRETTERLMRMEEQYCALKLSAGQPEQPTDASASAEMESMMRD